jgi:hypothetical protein
VDAEGLEIDALDEVEVDSQGEREAVGHTSDGVTALRRLVITSQF